MNEPKIDSITILQKRLALAQSRADLMEDELQENMLERRSYKTRLMIMCFVMFVLGFAAGVMWPL